MSRVTDSRKKRLQHKMDAERSQYNHALKRSHHPKPVSKDKAPMGSKRRAALDAG